MRRATLVVLALAFAAASTRAQELSTSRGASARTGSNFNAYTVAWQMHWRKP
jgi:hypothetical protein